MAAMAFEAEASGPINVLESLGWWLHGQRGGVAHPAAATIWVDDARQTWVQLYPTAPEPFVAEAASAVGRNLDELLAAGSPVLMLHAPEYTPLDFLIGGAVGEAVARVQVSLFCRVWIASTGTGAKLLDPARSNLQLAEADYRLDRLLERPCPLWEFTAGAPSSQGGSLMVDSGPSLKRGDDYRSDRTVELRWLRGRG
jgi:hypothetical protein